MNRFKNLSFLLIALLVLSGCNKKESNPLYQMPVKQAAKLLFSATKASNSKAGLPLSGDTYLMCLNKSLSANNCHKLYDLMAENLTSKGFDLSATTLGQFHPSDELKKELRYQILVDDED